MTHITLLLSRDTDLVFPLAARLERDIPNEIRWCSDLDAVRAAREQYPLATMFVDCRLSGRIENLGILLQELEADPQGGVDLIAISDQYYPLETAAYLDLQAVRHLEYPFQEEELIEVIGFVAAGGRLNGKRRMPVAKKIEAGTLQLATYTPAMFGMIDELMRVAHRDVTLLIIGETGTGKTTLAQIVHQLSGRGEEPFQNVPCGALPRELIESELFGHVRGAFTGAERNKVGRFEAAGRGTLLLDEIDVLSPKDQAKLLRVIETSEYEPVGSTETRISQARLVVAANVDLKVLTETAKFRSDLYYRLNVLQFHLLPLRERVPDIVSLAMRFVHECCEQHRVTIQRVHREFLQALKDYHWPGNLRELRNHIQRATLFSVDGELRRSDLADVVLAGSKESSAGEERGTSMQGSLADRVARNEREILRDALQMHQYSRTATAKALGISRVGLYKKMRKYDML